MLSLSVVCKMCPNYAIRMFMYICVPVCVCMHVLISEATRPAIPLSKLSQGASYMWLWLIPAWMNCLVCQWFASCAQRCSLSGCPACISLLFFIWTWNSLEFQFPSFISEPKSTWRAKLMIRPFIYPTINTIGLI